MIGSHNTGYGDEKAVKKYPRPKVYGVALDVETGDIFPADFPDDSKGPDAELRHIRLSFRQYESYEEYHEVKNFLYQGNLLKGSENSLFGCRSICGTSLLESHGQQLQ